MLKIALLFIGTLLYSSLSAQDTDPPVPVIFDTDMGPDYDDVGAIALLHAYADQGHAEILATVASTKYEGVAAVLNVLNTYFKRPNIPIAVPKDKAVMTKDFQHWTDSLIANYPHAINKNEEFPDAVSLYRKEGRMSWDQTAVLVGIKGHAPYYKLVSGRMIVKDDGSNDWDPTGSSHYYLLEDRPFIEVQHIINDLMMHQPK